MSTANAKAAVEAMLVAAAIADDAIADLRAALVTLEAKEREVWNELQAVRHPSVAQGGYSGSYNRRGIVAYAKGLPDTGGAIDVYARVLASWSFLNPSEPD